MLQAPLYQIIFVIVGTVIILFFIVFFYLLIHQLHRRRTVHMNEMLSVQQEYERTLLQSQLEIQESIFRNLSQEIHDNVGQVLSLAKLNLNTVLQNDNNEKIVLAEELLTKAITDLRDLSRSLHGDKIATLGLVDAVEHECKLIQRSTNIAVEFVYDYEDEIWLTNEQTIVAFRMTQEVLNNVVKHANANNVKVHIWCKGDKCNIHIADNGIGFVSSELDPTKTGIGLSSIKNRARLINGTVDIRSRVGLGTDVFISITQKQLHD